MRQHANNSLRHADFLHGHCEKTKKVKSLAASTAFAAMPAACAYLAQWRYIPMNHLLGHSPRHFLPPVQRVLLGIEGVQPAIAHLNRLGVHLNSFVNILKRVMPPVPEILAVSLAKSRAAEAQLFVCTCLPPQLLAYC